ncbi:MAG: imidazolonepropionase [Clostridiales bacterium]|nr:imidazolonepropionase [Clostridiales bacterium]
MNLLIHNIGLLATPLGRAARGGAAQGDILTMEGAYVLIRDGRIAAVEQGMPADHDGDSLDAGGRLCTPGLVDAHTHLVFGGWREHELALKLQGVPYLDILARGGGILSTVRATRAAGEDELADKALRQLQHMLALGVTTCECKSGYGLDTENELKQLRVTRTLQTRQPITLVSTFMGAHALPEEYKGDREGYIDLLIREMLPQVAAEGLADYCDVFCEQGVFSAEESRRILTAAQALGMGAKVHADEVEAIGGSRVAGEIGAISAEHLIAADDAGIAALKAGGVIACLLPATSLYLGKPYARARDMIAAGVPVCAATDFNPGSCPGGNMQLVMNLACWQYRLLPREVLTAVTLNAAAASGQAKETGTLEKGKRADVLLWDSDNLDYIFYRFGQNLVHTVIKDGNIVVKQ